MTKSVVNVSININKFLNGKNDSPLEKAYKGPVIKHDPYKMMITLRIEGKHSYHSAFQAQ